MDGWKDSCEYSKRAEKKKKKGHQSERQTDITSSKTGRPLHSQGGGQTASTVAYSLKWLSASEK